MPAPKPLTVVVDLVLVVIFAAIGRASHREAVSLAGLATTAWPFLVGALVGWVIVVAALRRRPVVVQGVAVWLAALVVGMLLRFASGQGVQVAFVIVAAVVLGLFLVGWRIVAALVNRRHTPAA